VVGYTVSSRAVQVAGRGKEGHEMASVVELSRRDISLSLLHLI
jgi:hypothetical protein